MSWPCFLIEEADPRVEYIVGHDVANGFHRVVFKTLFKVEFEDAPYPPSEGWPESCPQCGVELDYGSDDRGAGWYTKMGTHDWRNPATGEVRKNQHDWGPGAMFDASGWGSESWRGPDGKIWGVVLPPGGQTDIWIIDGEARDGGRWTRVGTPPKLSVTPSILTSRYHGFLTDGVLTDSLPDRPL